MTRLMSQMLRRFTPRMLRSDSPDRPMVVRRRHWFLQETRFLFLTRKGPVEIIVKPALILGAAFVGFVGTGVIAAATLFVGYKSVEVVTTETITPAEASAPQMLLPATDRAIAAAPQTPDPAAILETNVTGTGNVIGVNPTQLAMATTPPPSWPPSLAATDAAPEIAVIIPPASAKPSAAKPAPVEPVAPYWPPSLASTGTVAPITVPPQMPALPRADGVPVHLDEPDMMIPVPSATELAALLPFASGIPAPSEPTLPRTETLDHAVETIAMMTPPVSPPSLPADDGLEMIPDSGGDLPVFGAESRQRKLLRSMAREVRGIRESLTGVGLSEASLPEIGSLQAYVEQADFANLAMAVEDHRSALRKVPLKPPMLYFYISSNYGWRKHPVLKEKRFHHGIDLAGTWQETVHAPAPGTVIFAGRKGSFGKVVQIRHAHGVTTTYAHLAKITVRKGADVVPGTIVGKMGRTGRVAGAHLHYEIRLGDKSLDPQLFFDIGHRIGVGGELLLASDAE